MATARGGQALPVIKPTKNLTGVGPQNAGLPSYRPGDVNNPNGVLQPGISAPAPLQGPAAPAPAPAAPDFNALTLTDPQYTTGASDLQRQNQLNLANLLKGYLGQAQGYQDNANAHNALFSGAAVHAQNYAAQNYADQQAQQAQNLQSGLHTLQNNVFNRLLTQLSGVNG